MSTARTSRSRRSSCWQSSQVTLLLGSICLHLARRCPVSTTSQQAVVQTRSLITRSACLSSTPGRTIRGTQFEGREIQRARKPSTKLYHASRCTKCATLGVNLRLVVCLTLTSLFLCWQSRMPSQTIRRSPPASVRLPPFSGSSLVGWTTCRKYR